MNFRKIAISFFIIISLITGCTSTNNKQTNQGLKIVTTISPLYSLTTQLVNGTKTQITNIVPPNSSIHTFQLRPSDAKAITSADLIIINGLDLEEFLHKSLSNSKATIIDTSHNIKAITIEEEHDEEEHQHGQFDPHIWLDPQNAILQTQTITNALIKADPQNKLTYQSNSQQLIKRLQDLTVTTQSRINALNIEPYIVLHNAYSYFENQFGIKPAAFIEEFPGKEPSAQYLKDLTEIIEQKGIKVIFSEPQFNPKTIKTLSDKYNLKISQLDPSGAPLTINGYFDLFEKNVTEFEKVFTPK